MKEWQQAHSVERSQEHGSAISQFNQHDALCALATALPAVWMLPPAQSAITQIQGEAPAGEVQQAWGGTTPVCEVSSHCQSGPGTRRPE